MIKGDEFSGYEPDVVVLDKTLLKNEPNWEKKSTLMLGNAVKLVIEIVSSNWSDDYALKLDAYETLGIEEYWIVDYLGLGGRKFIGYPKQPTLTIYTLEKGEYQATQFRVNQELNSRVFPEVRLTAPQIFQGDYV